MKVYYKQRLTGFSRLELKVPGRLLSQLAAIGEVETFKRWSLVGSPWVIGVKPLKGL